MIKTNFYQINKAVKIKKLNHSDVLSLAFEKKGKLKTQITIAEPKLMKRKENQAKNGFSRWIPEKGAQEHMTIIFRHFFPLFLLLFPPFVFTFETSGQPIMLYSQNC